MSSMSATAGRDRVAVAPTAAFQTWAEAVDPANSNRDLTQYTPKVLADVTTKSSPTMGTGVASSLGRH